MLPGFEATDTEPALYQEEPPRSATGEDRRKFLRHDDCEYRFLVVSGCGIQSLPEWVKMVTWYGLCHASYVQDATKPPPTLFQSTDYTRQRDARVIQENRVNDWLATLTFCLLRLLQGRSIELCMNAAHEDTEPFGHRMKEEREQ